MDRERHLRLLDAYKSKLSRVMTLYLETCSRCGLCTQACHVYASMPQIKYSPVYRAELVRRLYRKYFSVFAGLRGIWRNGSVITDDDLEAINEAAYSCTGCRRCMVYCPFGLDTPEMVSIAKLLIVEAGLEPAETLTTIADVSISKAQVQDSQKAVFLKGIKRLEPAVVEKWRTESGKTPIPVEVIGAEVLYVPLAWAHSIIPAAAIFNAAGEHWTMSYFEAINFGAFAGDPVRTKKILDRIVAEALRLKVREVVICECGLAYQVMKNLSGRQPFKVSSITEVEARYLEEGRIKLRPGSITAPVTYHDPCQIARNGGIIDQPRLMLSVITTDYREMARNPHANWCCGGGGGLVALGDDTLEFRMKSAKVKARQIKETGASLLVTACENCHHQLRDLNEYYGLGMEVKFLTGLLADALTR